MALGAIAVRVLYYGMFAVILDLGFEDFIQKAHYSSFLCGAVGEGAVTSYLMSRVGCGQGRF